MLKVKLSLVMLLIIASLNVYGQEEFFGNRNGLSAFYLNGLGSKHSDASAAGVSAYFKNGLGISGGYVNNGYETSPIISLGYFVKDKLNVYPGLVLSASYVPVYDMAQLGFAGIKTLFVQSSFPSSISGGVTVDIEPAEHDKSFSDINAVVGLDYHQAFFAKKRIYPYAGISFAYVPFGENYMFSAMAGLNISLGKRDE